MSGKPTAKVGWQVTGATVRGANHTRNLRPNQDAIHWQTPQGPQDPAILAIADGHGSSRYVRSHRGAKFAVGLAVETLLDFAREHHKTGDLAQVARLAAETLPRTLVRRWQDQVRADLLERPLDALELTKFEEQPARAADPLRAYGATLVTAVMTSRYLLFCQLGDGDILIVDGSGEVSRPPLPVDPRLVANQTTSLCGQEAWRDMRVYFQPLANKPPSLIMLASDGYANSFADQSGFYAAAADLLSHLQTEGLQRTTKQLPQWLHATSTAGSGDDISVGLGYRGPVGDPSEPSAPATED
jgi:hypothetical protein